jgi:hypothetical protein
VRVVLDVEVGVLLEVVHAEALQPQPLLRLHAADAARNLRSTVLLHLKQK